MRLLYVEADGKLAFNDYITSNIPPYAILSHTWGSKEVIFQDIVNGTAVENLESQKLQFCLEQAAADGLKYCWVDSCCIDKSNSTELQQAINSMFSWYQKAAKCYVYLTDVLTEGDGSLEGDGLTRGDKAKFWESAFRESRWFTRGWTLQELIAPTIVEFFSAEGKRLGDKESMAQTIRSITGIPISALRGKPLSDFSRRERRLWTHRRTTTIEEDQAYCLLGLFEVHLPLIYGEGVKEAFIRLEETIDKRQAREGGFNARLLRVPFQTQGVATSTITVDRQVYRQHDEAGEDVRMGGIIHVFRRIIILFDSFAASKSHGHQAVVILTQLDMEKFVLLEWAENVSIFNVKLDQRLQDPNTRRFVIGILNEILHLLSDPFELEDQHGVKTMKTWEEEWKKTLGNRPAEGKSEQHGSKALPTTSEVALLAGQLINSHSSAPAMSDHCLKRLGLYAEVPCVPGNKRQESNDEFDSGWVIENFAKFGVLIEKIASLVTHLRKQFPLNPVLSSSPDLEAVETVSQLETIIEAATEHREEIADSTRHIIRVRNTRQRILDILWFRVINQRLDSITNAHESTFQWALRKPKYGQPWDDFSQWLQEGTGLYWISGKAGSGKSTLMKYIYSSKCTKQYLSCWAGESTCTMVDFFFWHLGTPEQNTQEGLARGLLYRILSHKPELIAMALPDMWKDIWDGRTTTRLPSHSETIHAFEVIASSGEALSRLCIFIDGLDEYIGNYCDGINFIKSLAINQQIKIVISSRPIPECVAAFKHLPKLQLQDLTYKDILIYVQDVIGGHPYMKRLTKNNPRETERLVDDIVNKSSGVFLWVVLACRSLQSGFANYDRIPELQERVNDLPEELEDMFKHMLSRVTRRYQYQAARLLRLCYAQQKAQRWAQVDSMYALGLVLIADYHVEETPVRALSDAEKRGLCDDLDGRLRSRCGGLLEMVKHGKGGKPLGFCFCSHQHDPFIDARVCFMHRTVFEFLSQKAVWDLEYLKLETNDSFDVATAMSLSRLHLAMQSIHGERPRENQAISCLQDGVQFGSHADHLMPNRKDHIFWKLTSWLDCRLLKPNPMPRTQRPMWSNKNPWAPNCFSADLGWVLYNPIGPCTAQIRLVQD